MLSISFLCHLYFRHAERSIFMIAINLMVFPLSLHGLIFLRKKEVALKYFFEIDIIDVEDDWIHGNFVYLYCTKKWKLFYFQSYVLFVIHIDPHSNKIPYHYSVLNFLWIAVGINDLIHIHDLTNNFTTFTFSTDDCNVFVLISYRF